MSGDRKFKSCRVAAMATAATTRAMIRLVMSGENYDLLRTDAITSPNQITNSSIMSPITCASFRTARAGT